jgi:general secretion pathway protein H
LQVGDDKMFLPATDRDGKILEYDEAKERRREERDRRAADAYNRSTQSQAFRGIGGEDDGEDDGALRYAAAPRSVPRRKPPLFDAFEEEIAMTGLTAPITLPEGIKITYVRTADDVKPITAGQASLYFFPRGRTQEAHIHLEDQQSNAKWTIKVSPLTGRITLEEGHEELKLPNDPKDEVDDLGRRQQRRTL